MKNRDMDYIKKIGNKIKMLRVFNRKTQKNIAEYLGISYQQYGRYECGLNDLPIVSLVKLASLYGKPINELFDIKEFKKVNEEPMVSSLFEDNTISITSTRRLNIIEWMNKNFKNN